MRGVEILAEEREIISRELVGGRSYRWLEQKWSPTQMSKRLRRDFPDDDTMRVSHEAMVRHEAPGSRVEVRDLRRRAFAAVGGRPGWRRAV